MAVDVALIGLLVASLLLGIYRGALRQLVALGAWFITFLLAAHLRPIVADWLVGQLPQVSSEYLEMVAFVAVFVLGFGLALAIIEIGGKDVHLIRRPLVDDLLGGLLMVVVAILAITAIVIALDSYYATQQPPPGAVGLSIVDGLHSAFENSAIVDALRESLVPWLQSLLGPLLPEDVRAVA